ncbi:unnamed protein product [Aspergillus oryzae]|uniref:Unnamed protein product n=1 Tax=Aspergillus oryzae var. brunneus TaxID=332754 RepID=A0ABQ6KKI0_ASPOZ|nr:unnamed protein product [Aspergillus oryzae]GMF83801.1 unnamed protein product [Aspergillus oryzae]GMG06155.1 unnamed protein product [Aspergillus oryzae]GMG42734.1 unnamed protein product [Aspergillus oryzae var. brunneus]
MVKEPRCPSGATIGFIEEVLMLSEAVRPFPTESLLEQHRAHRPGLTTAVNKNNRIRLHTLTDRRQLLHIHLVMEIAPNTTAIGMDILPTDIEIIPEMRRRIRVSSNAMYDM